MRKIKSLSPRALCPFPETPTGQGCQQAVETIAGRACSGRNRDHCPANGTRVRQALKGPTVIQRTRARIASWAHERRATSSHQRN